MRPRSPGDRKIHLTRSRLLSARVPRFALLVAAATLAPLLLWPPLPSHLFASDGFLPHGHCYLWKPALVWMHLTTSDSLIGLSYVAISATLGYLVLRARDDIPFHWMLAAFGLFIVACGATHFMEIWTLWHPTYWLSGHVKILTAAASVTTAVALPPLVPRVLGLVQAAKISEERRRRLETANARWRSSTRR